jgi:hypothetical protein
MTGPSEGHVPSLARSAVYTPAVALAGAIGLAMDLSAYRLAGGTALAWALGHRRSDDLDFFTRAPGHLDAAEKARLADALRRVDSTAKINDQGEATLHGLVLDCRVSFFGLPGQWLSPPTMVAEGFGLASLDDIAAMKLVAVNTRCTKKDFFDLHALVKQGYDGQRMITLLRQMYGPSVVDSAAEAHIARCLLDCHSADAEPDPVVLDGTTWTMAAETAAQLAAGITG